MKTFKKKTLPQTSGGLLLSVPRDQARELLRPLDARDVQSAVQVGEITDARQK